MRPLYEMKPLFNKSPIYTQLSIKQSHIIWFGNDDNNLETCRQPVRNKKNLTRNKLDRNYNIPSFTIKLIIVSRPMDSLRFVNTNCFSPLILLVSLSIISKEAPT